MARKGTSLSFSLQQRVAIITGGSRGIGGAISLRLAQAGADVAIVHSGKSEPRALLARVKKLGRQALHLPGIDVSEEQNVKAAVTKSLGELGRIDILVNNAGIYVHSFPERTTTREWDHVVDVNLKGAFLFSREVARHMIARRMGGRIVNIGSIDAFSPEAGFAHYDSSKAGLVGLTRSLALSWGKYGITVNAVSPGLVNTNKLWKSAKKRAQAFVRFSPLATVLEPVDIANVVAFLCSDEASKITGQNIVIDSGATLEGYMALARD